MLKRLPSTLATLLVVALCSCSDKQEDSASLQQDTEVVLRNKTAELKIDRMGGAYISFTLNSNPINPLSWILSKDDMPANNQSGAAFQGHFLCVGRWGSPTDGEISAGVPHNGEPSRDIWEMVVHNTESLTMKAEAPLDGVSILRKVDFDANEAAFLVKETIISNLSHGRLYNHVQHPTLGPPFLKESTIVNSNAGWGFLQTNAYPNPEKFEFKWPEARVDSASSSIDLTSSQGDFNYVSTHIFNNNQQYGWITAATSEQNLLIGYIWRLKEYPWLNVWHHSEDNIPVAKGLEFGTTGIGKSYQDLLNEQTRYRGYNSFEFLDAGEEKEKSFIGFLMPVSNDFKGIEDLTFQNGTINLYITGSSTPYSISTDLKL